MLKLTVVEVFTLPLSLFPYVFSLIQTRDTTMSQQFKVVEPMKEIKPNIFADTQWDSSKSRLVLTLANHKAVPVEARVRFDHLQLGLAICRSLIDIPAEGFNPIGSHSLSFLFLPHSSHPSPIPILRYIGQI